MWPLIIYAGLVALISKAFSDDEEVSCPEIGFHKKCVNNVLIRPEKN